MTHNGKELETQKKLEDYELPTECVVLLQQRKKRPLIQLPPMQNFLNNMGNVQQQQQQQQQFNPQMLMNQILSDINLQRRLRNANPPLLEAALSGNLNKFTEIYTLQQKKVQEDKLRRERELIELQNDPFSVENQQKIEELIRQENVSENMEFAMEHNPESFARVIMLYIDCEVNGHPMKAFVDRFFIYFIF